MEQKVNKRYSPKTECMKNPREVCGPGPCPLEPAPEECREETKTVRFIESHVNLRGRFIQKKSHLQRSDYFGYR